MSQVKQEEGRSVIIVVDDMFFAARIRGTAESLGIPITFARSASAIEAALDSGTPALVIVDLNSERLDPIEIIGPIRASSRGNPVQVIGFLSHVQVDRKQRAEAAGYDCVLPRSLFTSRLPDILNGTF